MVHREFGRERSVWRKLGFELLFAAVFLGCATAVFILGDLALYGHVNW